MIPPQFLLFKEEEVERNLHKSGESAYLGMQPKT